MFVVIIILGTLAFVIQAARQKWVLSGWIRTCYLALHVLPGVLFGIAAAYHVGVLAEIYFGLGVASVLVIIVIDAMLQRGRPARDGDASRD
jgi:ABC-type Fe3+ transport system permease subunit